MDSLTALRQTFFQECEEQLGELELGLVAMDEGDTGSETVNAVFRAVHSIKGGAGAFKLERLVKFAHTFETTLDMIRSERLVATSAVLKTMLRSSDALADLVKAARTGEELDEGRTASLLEELKDYTESVQTTSADGASSAEAESLDFQPVTFSFDAVAGPGLAIAPEATRYAIAFAPSDDLYRGGNDATRLLRELGRFGEPLVTCDASALPLLDALDPERAYLKWRVELTTEESAEAIQDVFEFVSGLCELSVERIEPELEAAAVDASDVVPSDGEPAPESPEQAAQAVAETPPPAPPPPSERAKPEAVKTETAPTIRVDLERIDRLINLVGELVINQAMLTQCVSEAGVRSSSVTGALDALEQLTREIQEGVMAVRAQPVKPLFQRMARIVRELADTTGKSVRLRTDGEATEVDRTVIERLADPLTHMIRNAVDHGLESPEKRLAAGKPDQGEVHLLAAHRSGRVVIEVSDDGAGINRPKVQEIAVNKGLIPADAVLTDTEVDNLLFLPGFSTASSISNISGRGVGMDVVKRSIQAFGGRISISSRPGLGSTFSMSLPLTLAVLDGMVVKVADQTLVVPLTAIVETLRPKAGDIHGLGVDARVISDRGGFAPLIDVGRELGYRRTNANPHDGIVMVVETEGSTRCGLIVDTILDQRQVVIKSLEANYRHVPGIAAATILGDGRVALILDIDTFLARTNRGDEPSGTFMAAAE